MTCLCCYVFYQVLYEFLFCDSHLQMNFRKQQIQVHFTHMVDFDEKQKNCEIKANPTLTAFHVRSRIALSEFPKNQRNKNEKSKILKMQFQDCGTK